MLAVIFLPLAAGMLVLGASPGLAARFLPFARTITGIAVIATVALCLAVYGEALLGVPGSLAVVALLVFFFALAAFSYWFAFGLRHEQKIVLSIGMTTRNLGAAVVPLLAVAQADQRAIVMVVLALPVMVMAALLSARWFARGAAADPCQYPERSLDSTEPGKP
jgi:BASS family bile acid:Na+ symporter